MGYAQSGHTRGWVVLSASPNRRRRKWPWALAGTLVLLASVSGWWLLCAPLRPGDEARIAWYEWLPRKLKTVAVNAIGGQISSYIRNTVETQTFKTNLSTEQMTSRLSDEHADPVERRRDAYRLATSGVAENLAAVQRYLRTASVADRAATAQLLGVGGKAVNKPVLWSLLDDPEQDVVRGAIRGLSFIGGDDVTARLTQFLNSVQTPAQTRIEAAAGLGALGTESAYAALAENFDRTHAPELTTAILQGLSRFPFTERTERIFSEILNAPDVALDVRVEAVETLSDCPAGAVPFVLNAAKSAADWEVRAGAAWALSKLELPRDKANVLLDMAQADDSEIVRRRLYEAVISHPFASAERLFALVESEQDVAARVAGFNAAGVLARRHPENPELAARFDATAVAEMTQVALSENPLNLRLRAVFALRRAQTPAALAALEQIGSESTGAVAEAALNSIVSRR